MASILNLNVITQYQINFVNKIDKEPGISTINKFPNTLSIKLTDFLYGWSNAVEINEYLMPLILDALEGKYDPETNTTSSGGTDIVIENDFCRFFSGFSDYSSYLNPELIIPTLDFKEIVLAWRDFLLTAPLNGTVVK